MTSCDNHWSDLNQAIQSYDTAYGKAVAQLSDLNDQLAGVNSLPTDCLDSCLEKQRRIEVFHDCMTGENMKLDESNAIVLL